jgi:cyclophilin family peptidyl-prolyl cis-trans isomerase
MKLSKIITAVAVIALAGCGRGDKTMKTEEVAVIETKFGKLVVALYEKDAPKTSANFLKLAKEGFYNGTTFHRVIPNFMIQGGDPSSKDPSARSRHGTGGPGYTVEAEIKREHKRGTLATARTGDEVNPERRSSGSQFFINVKDNSFLNGGYTVFGEVIAGMDVADKIVATPRDGRDNPNDPVTMKVTVMSRDEALKAK